VSHWDHEVRYGQLGDLLASLEFYVAELMERYFVTSSEESWGPMPMISTLAR
jgi:hypothetical protein